MLYRLCAYEPLRIGRHGPPHRQQDAAPAAARFHSRSRVPMKITIDIDCTPAEARQFMGLPDFEPMQKAAMAEIEKRMLAELAAFSPEALFKSWLPMTAFNPEWLQGMMGQSKKKS
jgi:hypothetical protein